jgi:hypothetical protein
MNEVPAVVEREARGPSRPLSGRQRAASFTCAAPRMGVAPPQERDSPSGSGTPAQEGLAAALGAQKAWSPKGSRVSTAYGHGDRGKGKGWMSAGFAETTFFSGPTASSGRAGARHCAAQPHSDGPRSADAASAGQGARCRSPTWAPSTLPKDRAPERRAPETGTSDGLGIGEEGGWVVGDLRTARPSPRRGTGGQSGRPGPCDGPGAESDVILRG